MTITFGMNIDNTNNYIKTNKAKYFSTGESVRASMIKAGNTNVGGPSSRKVFTDLPKDFTDWEKGANLIDLSVNEIPNKQILLLKEISKLNRFTKKLNRHKSLTPEQIQSEFGINPNLKFLFENGNLPGTKGKTYESSKDIMKNLEKDDFNYINNYFLKTFNLEELRNKFEAGVKKHLPIVRVSTEYVQPTKKGQHTKIYALV